MKTSTIIFSLIATASLALAQAPNSTPRRGPEIIVDRASRDIFPESWLTEKVNATADPLSAEAQPRGREIVKTALAKYPPSVVAANLKKVYVLGGLKYRGVPTGGTRSSSAVYVVSKARYSDAEVENIFHAEFSSILLRNFRSNIDEAAWLRINPPGFTYRGSGVQAIQNGEASLRPSEALHEEGFLAEDSKASLEEDFNGYAGRLFMGNAALWSAIEKYPKVKAKVDLTIAFYGKLDPTFTKDYFQSLAKGGTK